MLIWLGVIDAPIQMLYTDAAILIGMALCLSAADGAAALCQHGKLDFRLVEAGYDLYATRFQVLRRIIIPLVKPGIIAGSILVFIPSLGAYVTPRVLGGGKNMMIGNLIELQFGQGRNWPLGAALSITLMVIVMVALLVYVRKASKAEAAMARMHVSRSGGSPASRRSPCSAFVLLYPPIVTLVVLFLQCRTVGGDLGRLFAALVSSRPGTTSRSRKRRCARCSSPRSRQPLVDALPPPWRRWPPRGPRLPRPDRHLCGDQPAADGAGDRHRGGAADLLLAHQGVRPAIPGSAICSPPTRPSAFPSPICRSGPARKHGPDAGTAAADLYATPWKTFRRVTLPLLWPGIIAGLMLAFVISLDDVVITEFVKSGGQDTLPTYMLGQLRRIMTPEINAISTVFLLLRSQS